MARDRPGPARDRLLIARLDGWKRNTSRFGLRRLPLCPACRAALEGQEHKRKVPESAARAVVCLYLSDAVVSGWWQGTLDAFGVGFIVAGVVDVFAIAALNQALSGELTRRSYDLRAETILSASQREVTAQIVDDARVLLAVSGRQVDRLLSIQLSQLIDTYDAARKRDSRPAPQPPGGRPDQGESNG